MTLNQLLNEETYDLSVLEPFRKLLYNKLSKRLVFPIQDVTKYFKSFIKDKELRVVLSMAKTKEEENYVNSFNTPLLAKVSIIFMHLDKHFTRKESISEEDYRAEFLKNYEHEVIHVLDLIRSAKKHIGGTFIPLSNKNRKANELSGDDIDFGPYILSDSEFNRTINGIKIMSKKYLNEFESYNKINNKEKLIDYFISKSVNSDSIMHDNDEFEDFGKSVMSLRKDPTFIRKVIERLTREKLMPTYYGKKVPKIKAKIKEKTSLEHIEKLKKALKKFGY